MSDLLAQHNWRLRQNIGPQFYAHSYIEPTGRHLTASDIEWAAIAEKS